MEPSSLPDLIAILGTIGGIALAGGFGAWAVKRARATRQREIAGADDARGVLPTAAPPRRTVELDEPAAGLDRGRAGAEAEPENRDARGAQILPFPGTPGPVPVPPVAPPSALAPGL